MGCFSRDCPIVSGLGAYIEKAGSQSSYFRHTEAGLRFFDGPVHVDAELAKRRGERLLAAANGFTAGESDCETGCQAIRFISALAVSEGTTVEIGNLGGVEE